MADTPSVNLSTHSNLEYIGSVVAGLILLTTWAYLGVAILGHGELSAIPQDWYLGIILPTVIMAGIQVFGKDVYDIFTKNR
jgi:uncharacterized membrane protein